MTGKSNLEKVQDAYRNWSRTKGGNVDEILGLFHDEVEMHSALSADIDTPISGSRRTRAEAAEYFSGLLRDWEMIDYDVDRFIHCGDDVVMVGRCHWRNRATGQEVDSPKIDIHTFAGGKVVRFQESYDTLGFARALGAV